MELFLADANIPFSIALAIMLMLAVIEGILGVIGVGISQALDSLLPDINIEAPNIDTPNVDAPDAGASGAIRFLAWLKVGQVPTIILLVLFLLIFGLGGIALQQGAETLLGSPLSTWIAAPVMALLALPLVSLSGGILGRFLIRDETEVISTDDFTGHRATITVGEASQGNPAEARFKDQFGTTHYVMIEPDSDDTFKQGEEVLLLNQQGNVFIATRLDSSLLN